MHPATTNRIHWLLIAILVGFTPRVTSAMPQAEIHVRVARAETEERCQACAKFQIRYPSGRTRNVEAGRKPDLTIPVSSVKALLIYTHRTERTILRTRLVVDSSAAAALKRLVEENPAGSFLVSIGDKPISQTRINRWFPWEIAGGEFATVEDAEQLYRGGPKARVLSVSPPGLLDADAAIDRAKAEVAWRLACDPEFADHVRKRGASSSELEAMRGTADCSQPPTGLDVETSPEITVQGSMRGKERDGVWVYLGQNGEAEKLEIYDRGSLIETVYPTASSDAELVKKALEERNARDKKQ